MVWRTIELCHLIFGKFCSYGLFSKHGSVEPIVIDTTMVFNKSSKININKSAGPDEIFPRVLYEAK